MAASSDDERARLTKQYRELSDKELINLAEEGASLTDEARKTLRVEIQRRKLDVVVEETRPAEGPGTPQLTVIRTFRDVPAALLAKGLLDSAGLENFLLDENIVRLDWLYSNLVNGVKLAVNRDDVASAEEILTQEQPERIEVPEVGEYIQPRCPVCQSFDVSFKSPLRRVVYALLYLGLPTSFKHRAWTCNNCAHEWSDQPLPDLNWSLIGVVIFIGLVESLLGFLDGFGIADSYLWWAAGIVSSLVLARYAFDRKYLHAFIAGFAIGPVRGLAQLCYVYSHHELNFGRNFNFGYPLLWFAPGEAILGGLALVALTWIATFFLGEARASEPAATTTP